MVMKTANDIEIISRSPEVMSSATVFAGTRSTPRSGDMNLARFFKAGSARTD
jgi:hypothetical protein